MAFRTTDSILSNRPINPEELLESIPSAREQNVRFVKALDARCNQAGLDGPTANAQWLLESADGQSTRWVNDNNPTGVGIVSDGTPQPFRINTPEEAAALHVQCLYSLVKRELHRDIPLWSDASIWMAEVWLPKVRSRNMPDVRIVSDLGLRYVDNGRPRATWSFEDGIAPMDTYGKKLVSRLKQFYPNVPDQTNTPPKPGEDPNPMETITFGRVPMYGYSDRQHITEDKPEGVGWNNLGKRDPFFIALHRMWGNLIGTDEHFGNPSVEALTDVGIGVEAMDGKALAGHIYLWNDPLGYRSGWASGRVSAPYGDGKKIVDKYGLDAVNRNGFSVEISGKELTPIDDVAWQELVHLCAWWVDFMKIPYTTRVNPATGINYLIWHEEFTLGTGKKCPFDVVKALTNRLYNDIAAYLKPFQTGVAGEPIPEPIPVPEPEPIPEPQYAPPVPIVALAEFSDFEADSMRAVVTAEGHDFIFVNDIVKATKATPRLQRASATALHIGPVIEAGAEFEVTWLFEARDGQEYYLTPYHSRIVVEDTERVRDAT